MTIAGLYLSYDVGATYTCLWPDGHYYLGKPRWRPDGSWDFAASIAHADARHHGTFSVEADQLSPNRVLLVLTPADGPTQTLGAYRIKDDGPWKLSCGGELLAPPSTLAGTYRREEEGTALAFHPGNRFTFECEGEGTGRYDLNGAVLSLRFDDGCGDVEDIVDIWPAVPMGGWAIPERLVFGSKLFKKI